MSKAEELLSKIASLTQANLDLQKQMFVCLSDLVMVLKPRGDRETLPPPAKMIRRCLMCQKPTRADILCVGCREAEAAAGPLKK